jgi:hypothetical protein
MLLIASSAYIYPKLSNIKGINYLVASSSRNILSSPTNISEVGDVLAAIKGGDARPVLVDRFLAKYDSPMVGLGDVFVTTADNNGLDWRFLPALAFQESNLGKKMPKGSHNPFGWAVYKGKNSGAYFDSWKEGINVVAAGIKEDYVDRGYTTPETIVAKYASTNNQTWVFAVRSAMEEISETAY